MKQLTIILAMSLLVLGQAFNQNLQAQNKKELNAFFEQYLIQ
jgi:hypothetical protein